MADNNNFKNGIKKLGYGKFTIIFLIEIMLLIASLVYIFIPKKNWSYEIPEFSKDYTLKVDNQRFGRYIYKVEYAQEKDVLWVGVEAADKGFLKGHINTDGQLLRTAYSEYELEYWLTGIRNSANIKLINMEPGAYVKVNRIDIRETNFAAYVYVILTLIILGVTYFIYCIYSGKIKKESLLIILELGIILIIGALPLFTPYLQMGADAVFHLNRIEGIKESLLAGQFPVRVDSVFLDGYGYAVSTFYGSLFFYIPVAARLIGFSLQFSYKIFVMFLNIIMVINSYFFFKKITKDKKWGVIGCFCFTLFTYKFINMYSRAAISEASAMAVLPLLANVFYDVFTREHDRSYRHLWLRLTLVFSLIVENHIISTEIFGITMIIICVCYFKKTFSRDTFVVLLKFTVSTILLNAFFIVPFIKTITGMSFNINSWDQVAINMQQSGFTLKDLFYVQKPGYDYKVWYEQDIHIIPGISGILMFILSFSAIVSGIFKSNYKKIFKFFFIESVAVLVITSAYFPWDALLKLAVDKLGKIGLVITNMVTNIQFLFRISMLLDLFFTGLFILSIKFLVEKYTVTGEMKKLWFARAELLIVMIVTLGQTLSLETAVISTQYNSKYEKFIITELDEYYCKNIGNEEYIPRTLVTGWSWSGAYDDRSVSVVGGKAYNLSKKGTNMQFTVQTDEGVTAWIDIPLIYYFGYHAYNSDTGEEIGIFQNNSGKISFIMPENTTWNVSVVYRDEPAWVKADIVSVLTLICMAITSVYYVWRKRKA